MHCLLTRPKKDALVLAKILTSMGLTCHMAPMLVIKKYDLAFLEIKAKFVIITSKNTLSCYAHKFLAKETPLLMVGNATAELAKKLGFVNIITAQNNVEALLNFILANINKSASMLYLRAEDISFDVGTYLQKQGFEIKDLIVYQAQAVQNFSPQILELLVNQKIQIICFFSKRSAETFVKLSNKQLISFNVIKAFAISENVAKIIKSLPWHEIKIAKSANEQAMIELFK
jgi:uroporphyrinogen-III synthase